MKAMILAAGEGTRLRPLTNMIPKPMLPVGGKPLLEHTICWLRTHGIEQVAINLHHGPWLTQAYLGDGSAWGVRITYSLEDRLLGTAGAVKKLQSYFDDTFVVVYGDVLTNMDLTTLVSFHQAKGGGATIALYRVENPSACGLIELDGEGKLLRFVEKPPPEDVFTDLASTGVFVMEPRVLDRIPVDTFYDFGHHLFPALLTEGVPLYGYPTDTYLVDIGTMEKYRQAQLDVREGCLR
ncbi:MAG: nucleotidyltransferase family protein [Anaerolineae bacterium]